MAEIVYEAGRYDASLSGRVAVISTRWNHHICEGMLLGYRSRMSDFPDISQAYFVVPGAWEIPLFADRLAVSQAYDVLVAFGCLVKGKTKHFETVLEQSSRGCMEVSLRRNIPLVFEVLGVDDFSQAEQRSGNSDLNAGRLAAMTVLDLLGTRYD